MGPYGNKEPLHCIIQPGALLMLEGFVNLHPVQDTDILELVTFMIGIASLCSNYDSN